MKWNILHESRGRIRLHLRKPRMSLAEADQLQDYLTSLPGVRTAAVYERTCDVVIVYTESRAGIVRGLAAFRFDTEALAEVPANSPRAVNREYQEKLVNMTIFHFARKLFLPAPLRMVYTLVRSVPYIFRGLRCVFRRKLEVEVARTDSVARGLSASLDAHKRRYAEMVREAYRNYKHNNYLTYLFSSSDFNQVARRITNLREVAAMRERQMEQIVTLSEQVSVERTRLTGQQRALDSVKRSLTTQRTRLQKDSQAARANIKQLSKKEKAALQQKIAREQRLDVAIDELRKLTRGNKEGNTFTAKTSNLRLPVVGGGVKRYKGNMAEIAGPKGAQVISIYEGKVVEVKRNRITNKYDVYIAHGEYISSYANLNSVTVGKDDKVARNQQIGTIGSGVDVMTMQPEYKMVFGIYGPSPKVQMRASDCFKK